MSDLIQAISNILAGQASARPMTTEEIVVSIRTIHRALRECESSNETRDEWLTHLTETPMLSVKKSEIICLECGRSFQLLANRHLALHGLTPNQYKEKWGFRKGTPLSCTDLTRKRRSFAKKTGQGSALQTYREMKGIKAKGKVVAVPKKKRRA